MEANTKVIRLENQNVKFYLSAPPNSPIWGSAEDMKNWLENWHRRGMPIGENVVPEPVKWSDFMEHVFVDFASDQDIGGTELVREKPRKKAKA